MAHWHNCLHPTPPPSRRQARPDCDIPLPRSPRPRSTRPAPCIGHFRYTPMRLPFRLPSTPGYDTLPRRWRSRRSAPPAHWFDHKSYNPTLPPFHLLSTPSYDSRRRRSPPHQTHQPARWFDRWSCRPTPPLSRSPARPDCAHILPQSTSRLTIPREYWWHCPPPTLLPSHPPVKPACENIPRQAPPHLISLPAGYKFHNWCSPIPRSQPAGQYTKIGRYSCCPRRPRPARPLGLSPPPANCHPPDQSLQHSPDRHRPLWQARYSWRWRRHLRISRSFDSCSQRFPAARYPAPRSR